MRKPRKLNRTDNICGQCYYFIETSEKLAVASDELQGTCDIAEKQVWYRCSACKHFLDKEQALEARAREHAYSEYLKRMGYKGRDDNA